MNGELLRALATMPEPPDVNKSDSQERINYCITMKAWQDKTAALIKKANGEG